MVILNFVYLLRSEAKFLTQANAKFKMIKKNKRRLEAKIKKSSMIILY